MAAASFSRGGTIWLQVAAVVVAIWGASRPVINLKTIKSLGLTVPAAVLARAETRWSNSRYIAYSPTSTPGNSAIDVCWKGASGIFFFFVYRCDVR